MTALSAREELEAIIDADVGSPADTLTVVRLRLLLLRRERRLVAAMCRAVKPRTMQRDIIAAYKEFAK